jgi:coniferyl-aldehyde dehydrogenase
MGAAHGTIDGQRAALGVMLDRQRRAFMADVPATDAFVDAMAADFGTRSRAATLFTEFIGMLSVIEHMRSLVAQWMRPTKLVRAARPCGIACPLSAQQFEPRRGGARHEAGDSSSPSR